MTPERLFPEINRWYITSGDEVMQELFGKEDSTFGVGVANITFAICNELCDLDLRPNGYDFLNKQGLVPYAIITGSVARRHVLGDSPELLKVPAIFRDSLQNDGQSMETLDAVQRKALLGLCTGPFDLDIKIAVNNWQFARWTQGIKNRLHGYLDYASYATLLEKGGTKTWRYSQVEDGLWPATVSLKEIGLSNGKMVFTLDSDFKPADKPTRRFGISITNYPTRRNFPTWDELKKDFRAGTNVCDKQRLTLLLAKNEQYPDEILFVTPQAKWEKFHKQKIREHISKPEYVSLEQAFIAGLRMIRMACLWPGDDSPETAKAHHLIFPNTIRRYKAELARVFAHFLDSDEQFGDYRAEEIMREAVLCSTIDPVLFTRLSAELGILEIFFPQLAQYVSTYGYEKIADNQLAETICKSFVSVGATIPEFAMQYRRNLRSGNLPYADLGVLLFANALNRLLNYDRRSPIGLAGAVKLFDPRKIKERHERARELFHLSI